MTRTQVKSTKFSPDLFRAECLIETSQDWRCNYNTLRKPDRNGRHLKLIMLEFVDHAGWRVCVWGANDTGVEIDYTVFERAKAQKMFDLIRGRGPVTRKDLRAIGFQNA